MMMRKLLPVVLLAACGGGTDDGCPTDDCTLKARTTVKWSFNAYPELGFDRDSCADLGIANVAVDVIDADGFATSGLDKCGYGQAVFSGLDPGDYTVHVMPKDAAGNPLLSAAATGTVTAGVYGDNREVEVNVPWDLWLGGPYTGMFLFRISWGGLSCEDTEIKSQRLTLAVNGVVQQITTNDGQALNGSDKKPCKRYSDEFPQTARDVSFGMATLLVEGYDASDNMRFSHQFDTFVGAGISNPTLEFDVPAQ
jgi:hypothetical protein